LWCLFLKWRFNLVTDNITGLFSVVRFFRTTHSVLFEFGFRGAPLWWRVSKNDAAENLCELIIVFGEIFGDGRVRKSEIYFQCDGIGDCRRTIAFLFFANHYGQRGEN